MIEICDHYNILFHIFRKYIWPKSMEPLLKVMIYFCKLNYTTGIISNYYLIWKFSNIWIAIKLKISTKKLICFHFQSCFLIIRSQWINKRNVDIVCSRLKLTANFDFKTTIWSHLNLNDKKKVFCPKFVKHL